jgi:hypothetical protein
MTITNSLLQALNDVETGRVWQMTLNIAALMIGPWISAELLGYWAVQVVARLRQTITIRCEGGSEERKRGPIISSSERLDAYQPVLRSTHVTGTTSSPRCWLIGMARLILIYGKISVFLLLQGRERSRRAVNS